jgi:membrane-bound lytic murein transglycosylase B
MILSLESRESADFYAQFLTPETILLSKKFLRENQKILRKAESRFRVEKAVIVAILLVESRFGENIGKYRLIPTLASIVLMDSPDHLQKHYWVLRDKDPDLSYEWLKGISRRKANRAYYELKCFLNIIRYEKIDPLEVYGSYAGALGMAQFMPSSYLSYALNQESFENWLISKEAAIFSIGNYLKSHGWRKGLLIEKKKRILWYYNRSKPYGETILQVAQKIEQP